MMMISPRCCRATESGHGHLALGGRVVATGTLAGIAQADVTAPYLART